MLQSIEGHLIEKKFTAKTNDMRVLLFSAVMVLGLNSIGQTDSITKLPEPSKVKGKNIMEAFANRASVREFDAQEIDIQEIADLLWAANGINRPAEGKRTAPTAMNTQDIDIYLVNNKGAFLYDANAHALVLISSGDFRSVVAGSQQNFAKAPVFLVIVSDLARFQRGDENQKMTWAAMDAAIVSQNINLFCAGVGLKTRPRVWMDAEKLKEILKLKETQRPMMNNPVSR